MNNIYTTLGIDPSTPYDDLKSIKKAFKEKAHQHHPDKGGDEQEMKKLNEAFSIASDPSKRREYDLKTGLNPSVKQDPFQGFFGGIGGGFNFGSNPFFTRSFNMKRVIQINQSFNVDYLQLFNGTTIKTKTRLPSGQVIEKDIVIEPRQLKQYEMQVKQDENTDIVILFHPEIINDVTKICKDSKNVLVDNRLNIKIIIDIDFKMALSGGTIKTKVFNKTISTNIPKCCKHNHEVILEDFNLLPHSFTMLSFNYELPTFTDEQIEKITSIC